MANTGCVVDPNGKVCLKPSDWSTCRPWELTNNDKDACYMDSLAQEGLAIAGANINFHKLLGIHEQTKLVDLTGNGDAISGGSNPLFPASNAFTIYSSEWRSLQTGIAVTQSAYLGYDFGELKISTGRVRYGIDASVRFHITTIKIKQSSNPNARVTKARVERSDNGKDWYGVAIITLPNDDVLNTIHFGQSVPSRYWRLRPITTTSLDCNYWGVQALELIDYSETKYDNIQDKILMENRDREYMRTAITLKGYYDIIATPSDLTRFGIELPSAIYNIKINFNACVAALGRPPVVGDIIELPSETFYTTTLRPIKRYLEVTDVAWDTGSFTPTWQALMLLITAQHALATEETQDIYGDLANPKDTAGTYVDYDGNNPNWQDYADIEQTIRNEALSQVPERGSEGSNVVRKFSEEELAQAAADGFPHLNKIGFNPRGLYVEDAIPENNAPFTQGPDFPASPADGEYHRIVYAGLSKDIPARLYRYSTAKGRWVYLETDKRQQFNYQKEVLTEYLTAPGRMPSQDIGESE